MQSSDQRTWQEQLEGDRDAHLYSRNAPTGAASAGNIPRFLDYPSFNACRPRSCSHRTHPARSWLSRRQVPKFTPAERLVKPPHFGSGKSSFLRLLIDTSEIASNASKEQLQSVARFVQGCSGHTSGLRTVSVDIDVDGAQPLALTLIDTPSLDFKDDAYAERVVSETLRFVESRLAEGGDEVGACFISLLFIQL